MRIHFLLLTGFLIVSHVAMIFGMVEVSETPNPSHEMHDHHHMN